MLVERDQLAQHRRGQRRRHDRRGRPVAREDPRRHDRLVGALGAHLVGGLAEGQRRGLGEEVGEEQLVHVGRRRRASGYAGLATAMKSAGTQPGALVDQLVERVLAVGARARPRRPRRCRS